MHAAVKRPLDPGSMGSWKKCITIQQAKAVMAMCGDRAERLGYTLCPRSRTGLDIFGRHVARPAVREAPRRRTCKG